MGAGQYNRGELQTHNRQAHAPRDAGRAEPNAHGTDLHNVPSLPCLLYFSSKDFSFFIYFELICYPALLQALIRVRHLSPRPVPYALLLSGPWSVNCSKLHHLLHNQ